MRILILCTGNRCRSQMAHGILKYLCPSIEVHSAGVRPATEVHPLAIQVMSEIGIDISQHYPKSVDQYLNQTWNYVITVCGGARENCPVFNGTVANRLHIGFDDPDAFTGSPEELLTEFRRVRDEIYKELQKFAKTLESSATSNSKNKSKESRSITDGLSQCLISKQLQTIYFI